MFPAVHRVLCGLLAVCVVSAVVPSLANAASFVLRPNSDVTVGTQWSIDGSGAWAVLDDAVTQPTAPATGADRLSATSNGPAVAEVHIASRTLSSGEAISRTEAWVHTATGSDRSLLIELRSGSTVLASKTVAAGTSAAWHSVASTTALTQAQLDDVRVRVTMQGNGSSSATTVHAAYVLVQTSVPASYHAAPTGSGSTCSEQSPCSPTTAASLAGPGDEMVLAAGTYDLTSSITVNGARLRGAGTGERPVLRAAAGFSGTLVTATNAGHISDVTIESTTSTSPALLVTGATAERVHVTGAPTGVAIGLRNTGTVTSLLRNAIARGGSAVQAAGGGTAAMKVINVTALGDIYGARNEATAGQLAIVNTILDGPTKDFYADAGTISATIATSNFSSAGGSYTSDGGNQNAEPTYVNRGGGDLRAAAGSPTINSGAVQADMGSTDIVGNARHVGVAPDIGAYEYVPPPANTIAPSIPSSGQMGDAVNCTRGTWTDVTGYAYAWLRNGGLIAGETASSYLLAAADRGQQITCRVTATGPGGSSTAVSNAMSVAAAPPANTALPSIPSSGQMGDTVTCTDGTWTDADSFTRQWRRDGAAIAGASSVSYVIDPADRGRTLTCAVTATGPGGSSTAVSNAMAVTPPPPANTALPSIPATGQGGDTVTCTDGTWTDADSFTRQWRRDGAAIAGASSVSYVIDPADRGRTLTCAVTATGPGGTSTAVSNAMSVAAAPPANTALPSIPSSGQMGDTVTCTDGTWTDADSFTRQWRRDGAAIAGASSVSYVIDPADRGRTLTCAVTATGPGGTSTAVSNAMSVAAAPPANTVAPSIPAAAQVGDTIVCQSGAWTDATGYAYVWLRAGEPIAGATSASYMVVSADDEQVLRCRVTATGPGGSASATSDAAAITRPAPVSVEQPSIAASIRVGDSVLCVRGEWNDATTYSFAWLRDGAVIFGATAATYTTTADDDLTSLRCRVTATSSGGSVSAQSNEVAVTRNVPAATAAPSLPGSATATEVLTCARGTWTDASSYGFEWLRNGSPVAGATASTFQLSAADDGTSVRCRVTASGSGGSAWALSNATVVSSTAPQNLAAPSLPGAGKVRDELICDEGNWASAAGFAYEWLRDGSVIAGQTTRTYTLAAEDDLHRVRCRVTALNASGQTVSVSGEAAVTRHVPRNVDAPSLPAAAKVGDVVTCQDGTWMDGTSFAYRWLRDGSMIAGARSSTYVVGDEDDETRLRCMVIATSSGGSEYLTSSASFVTQIAPDNNAAPSLPAAGKVGGELTCDRGAWERARGFDVRWLRNGVEVPDQDGLTYALSGADDRMSVRCRVTARNSGGSTTVTSPAATITRNAPVNTVAPSLPASITAGKAARCAAGAWTDAPEFAFAWTRDGDAIASATGPAYTPSAQDVKRDLRCVVTARNSGGETHLTSAPRRVAAASNPPVLARPNTNTRPAPAAAAPAPAADARTAPAGPVRAGANRAGASLDVSHTIAIGRDGTIALPFACPADSPANCAGSYSITVPAPTDTCTTKRPRSGGQAWKAERCRTTPARARTAATDTKPKTSKPRTTKAKPRTSKAKALVIASGSFDLKPGEQRTIRALARRGRIRAIRQNRGKCRAKVTTFSLGTPITQILPITLIPPAQAAR